MIENKQYYMSSMDSLVLEEPRRCLFKQQLSFDTGKEVVLATLDPAVQIQYDGSWILVSEVILTARHEGFGLLPISYFPCFVYVSHLLNGDIETVDTISANDLVVIGIAELYRTENDAKNHVFDEK